MSSTTAAIQNVVDSLLNIYLLIVALVLALIVLAFAVYMLVYYQHPDDPDQTAGSKIIVIFSIWLVLFIPIFSAIDIASVASGCNAATTLREDWNRFIAGECKAPTQVILYTLMLLAVIWTYLIIPFALNLRVNSLSQPFGQRFLRALVKSLMELVVWVGLAALLWGFFGDVVVPVNFLASSTKPYNSTMLSLLEDCLPTALGQVRDRVRSQVVQDPDAPTCRPSDFIGALAEFVVDKIPSSSTVSHKWMSTQGYFSYVISIHTVVGMLVLGVLGGVGLAAFPFKYIKKFIDRPKRPLTKSEYLRLVRDLSERAQSVREKCLAAKDEEGKVPKRQTAQIGKKLRRAMVLLEQEDMHLEKIYPSGDDPDREWTMFVIGQYVSLIYGILGALVSICWIVQIYFYCIADTPQLLGLNRVFVMKDDQNFFLSFFSLVLLAFFSFHLTLCCNQGLFSLGMFFPCLPVYPLTLGSTMIEAFLQNCLVMLYSSPATLAFQVITLSLATTGTNTAYLFGFQLRYLKGWGALIQSNVFLILMMSSFTLTVIIGLVKSIRSGINAYRAKKAAEAMANMDDY